MNLEILLWIILGLAILIAVGVFTHKIDLQRIVAELKKGTAKIEPGIAALDVFSAKAPAPAPLPPGPPPPNPLTPVTSSPVSPTRLTIFDPSAYPEADQRLAAYQALQAKVGYLTPIYSPNGFKIDVRGDEIKPDGPAPVHRDTLDEFGAWVPTNYVAGVVQPYTIIVPAKNFAGRGFELVWGEAEGHASGAVTATVSGPAGTFSSSSSFVNGAVKVYGAKVGEVYTAHVVYEQSQPGHIQINTL